MVTGRAIRKVVPSPARTGVGQGLAIPAQGEVLEREGHQLAGIEAEQAHQQDGRVHEGVDQPDIGGQQRLQAVAHQRVTAPWPKGLRAKTRTAAATRMASVASRSQARAEAMGQSKAAPNRSWMALVMVTPLLPPTIGGEIVAGDENQDHEGAGEKSRDW